MNPFEHAQFKSGGRFEQYIIGVVMFTKLVQTVYYDGYMRLYVKCSICKKTNKTKNISKHETKREIIYGIHVNLFDS